MQRAPDSILDKAVLSGTLWLVAKDAILPQTGRSIPWAMFRPDLAISFLRCAPDVSSGEV
jgi:hypothetical protein